MGTGANWEQAKSNAMTILGSKAKIPDPKISIAKLKTDFDKGDKEFDAARDALTTKLVNLQNISLSMKNVIKQYQSQLSNSDFGLAKDMADRQTKIDKAQNVLDSCLDFMMGDCDTNIKNLGELEKYSNGLQKYDFKAP
jgi:hypothetical protein